MANFDHVISPFIRSILNGDVTSATSIAGAVYQTQWFMCEDWKSDLIPLEVMEVREECVDRMDACICASDFAGAVDAMRAYYSI